MRKLLSTIVAIYLAAIFIPAVALAGRSTVYARFGWWEINMFDDGTCFAYANYVYNQRIRIGIIDREKYYVMLASPGVADLKVSKGFTIVADFDDGQSYKGMANVNLSDSGQMKIMEFPIGGAMLNSLMISNNMHIYTFTQQEGKKLVATMNLAGSYAAMLKTAECTASSGGHYSQPTDPFHNVSLNQ